MVFVVDSPLRPGFPAMTELTLTQPADRLRGYVDDIARTDIRRLADVRHEPAVIKQLVAARSVEVEGGLNGTAQIVLLCWQQPSDPITKIVSRDRLHVVQTHHALVVQAVAGPDWQLGA